MNKINYHKLKPIIAFVVILTACISMSCQKDIEVELPTFVPRLVVEGRIEQGEFAEVSVMQNLDYFGIVDENTIRDIIIPDAFVTVSDGFITDTLELVFSLVEFPYVKYRGKTLRGAADKTYHLRIEHEADVATASTTIPMPPVIDSLKFKLEHGYDSLGIIWAYVQDPDTIGNFYRNYTKVVGVETLFKKNRSEFISDKLLNGQVLYIPMIKGYGSAEYQPENNDELEDDDIYIKIGETIIVKVCSIDYDNYTFWRTLYRQRSSGGNPFAASSSVRSNFNENGVLGVWGGYSYDIDTMVVTEDGQFQNSH